MGSLKISEFATFEELEAAFRLRAVLAVPRLYGGLRQFWSDFGELHRGARGIDASGSRSAWITSNPRDCLAFATPEQVLKASVMVGGCTAGEEAGTVRRLADRFELSEQLGQPLRTLSGGETVRLALAKVFGLADRVDRVTVASPFSWLSDEGRRHFDDLVDRLSARKVPVELLRLEGEDSREAAPPFTGEAVGPSFEVAARGVRFSLGTPLEALFGPVLWASVDDEVCTLRSPCHLTGGNGEGKSLVAKLMGGAMGHAGRLTAGAAGDPRPVRLLFQDILNQTLMRPPSAMADRAGADGVFSVYRNIRSRLPARLLEASPPDPFEPEKAGSRTPPGLFALKLVLAATRIRAGASALVLDEPDWGLTREAAVGLVAALTAAAHAVGVPVLLISHQPWWETWAASRLRVEKRVDGRGRSGGGFPLLRFRLMGEA